MWFIVAGMFLTLPFMVRSVAAVRAGPTCATMERRGKSCASFTAFPDIVLPNAHPELLPVRSRC